MPSARAFRSNKKWNTFFITAAIPIANKERRKDSNRLNKKKGLQRGRNTSPTWPFEDQGPRDKGSVIRRKYRHLLVITGSW